MIKRTIKERLDVAGWTQAELAEAIGCTPTQLSLFLKGDASLNHRALDKCFEVLGIPLAAMNKRIEVAKEAASKLSPFTIKQIAGMSKYEMVRKTGIKEIEVLPDVTKEEFELMVTSGIADYESTYPFFRTLVMQFRESPAKLTPKSVEQSIGKMAAAFIALPVLGFPLLGVGAALGAAVMALVNKNKQFAQAASTAWGSLLTITMNSFKKII